MSEGTLEAGEQQQYLFDTEAVRSVLDQLLTDSRLMRTPRRVTR
jgi:hypothetical protein